MRRIIKKTCVLLLATLYGPYALSAITPEQQAEIDYLLNAVEERRCRFVRNDISYSSSEFLGHLQSKLQLNEGLVNSSEEFIEKIGTRSAVSQIPYVALCDWPVKEHANLVSRIAGDLSQRPLSPSVHLVSGVQAAGMFCRGAAAHFLTASCRKSSFSAL